MQEPLNVLIVEDEPMISDMLKKMLLLLGAREVWICADDACAFETAMREPVDLVFMDLNIKGSTDGIQCARRIAQHKDVSIVFATSFCDGEVLEEAIDLNTLNYLVKPFGRKDVEITINLARIACKKQQQKRSASPVPTTARVNGDILLDLSARTLSDSGVMIKLSRKEFDLLALLYAHDGKTVTTETLRAEVWEHRPIASSTIRETIMRLRQKVPGVQITAVHGIGYRLDPNDT